MVTTALRTYSYSLPRVALMAEQEIPGPGPPPGARKIVGPSKDQQCPNIWQREGAEVRGLWGQRVSVHGRGVSAAYLSDGGEGGLLSRVFTTKVSRRKG